jgi:2,3-bisphosphoglycerate-independent phosphoglycerate mutase
MEKKAALVILDGWGLGNHSQSDAVFQANTPFADSLNVRYPHAELRTDGEFVGLPKGQMGNSEVGHMNIGAGRIVWQMLAKINRVFEDNTLSLMPKWQEIVARCERDQKPLHLIGLVSDGGVHAHLDHLIGLLHALKKTEVPAVYIHAFLDGRDTDPHSGLVFLQKLLGEIDERRFHLSSVIGRYYAMDRDQRWERVKKAYDLMVGGHGELTEDILHSVSEHYKNGITDEFMEPLKLGAPDSGLIQEDDSVLCFNFRTDRGRQITRALTQEAFPEWGMFPLGLHYYTFTQYDENYDIQGVLFETENLYNTLGAVLEKANKTQLRAAETEKYPHVTFFFSGGREEPYLGESRIMAASPRVATYDLQPEMSAVELTQRSLDHIRDTSPDFICLNYANADMVGHTGVYAAIIKAVETVDGCLETLVNGLLVMDYDLIIIADHGNADMALNADGSPNTAHSTNPVPIWYVSNDSILKIESGILADVAPTILQIMGIEHVQEMTGKPLLYA